MSHPADSPNLWRTRELDAVRYYLDEDLAGVGLVLRQLRTDVAIGGRSPIEDLVPRKDVDWIPVVAQQGWVVITNDRHIRTRPYEAQAAIEHRLRCVELAPVGRDAARWDFMRLLLSHWAAVEGLLAEEGPTWLKLRGDKSRRLEFKPCAPPRLPSKDLE